MSIEAASLITLLLGIYLLTGLILAVVFLARGAAVVDPGARDGTWGFRLLLLPGCMLLWPLILRWWMRHLMIEPEETGTK